MSTLFVSSASLGRHEASGNDSLCNHLYSRSRDIDADAGFCSSVLVHNIQRKQNRNIMARSGQQPHGCRDSQTEYIFPGDETSMLAIFLG